jgi:hypothetical protein
MLHDNIVTCWFVCVWSQMEPITVATRSETWIVFARSNTGVVGSNPIQGIDIYVRLFCVCVVLCVGSGLGDSLIPHPRRPTYYTYDYETEG